MSVCEREREGERAGEYVCVCVCVCKGCKVCVREYVVGKSTCVREGLCVYKSIWESLCVRE
jgi:hypothetical protein